MEGVKSILRHNELNEPVEMLHKYVFELVNAKWISELHNKLEKVVRAHLKDEVWFIN